MMRITVFTALMAIGLLQACDDSGTLNVEAQSGYIVHSVSVGGGDSEGVNYLKAYGAFPDGSIANTSEATQVPDTHGGVAYGEALYLAMPEDGDNRIGRFVINDDLSVVEESSLSLFDPNGGATARVTIRVVSAAKGYYAQAGHPAIGIFNPSTMEYLGEIDLESEIAAATANEGVDLSGFVSYAPMPVAVRDGVLFASLYAAAPGPPFNSLTTAFILAVDTDDDSYIGYSAKASTGGPGEIVPDGGKHFTDENGDLYIFTWGWPGLTSLNPQPSFIRVPAGSTELDNFKLELPAQLAEVTSDGAKYVSGWVQYLGDGQILFPVAEPFDYCYSPDGEAPNTRYYLASADFSGAGSWNSAEQIAGGALPPFYRTVGLPENIDGQILLPRNEVETSAGSPIASGSCTLSDEVYGMIRYNQASDTTEDAFTISDSEFVRLYQLQLGE